MNCRYTILFFLALALAGGCASAPTVDEPQAAQEVSEATTAEEVQAANLDPDDPDFVRCKRVKKTGTRFRTKVCATNREWELKEAAAQEATEAMQRRPQQGRVSN